LGATHKLLRPAFWFRHPYPFHPQGKSYVKMQAFSGQWNIISSPELNAESLNFAGPPYLRLRHIDGRLEGEFSVGACSGQLDGHPNGTQQVIFSFEGMDGDELVSGAATARLHPPGLHLVLMYHFGAIHTFECRSAQA
jgi:hypothetical protein